MLPPICLPFGLTGDGQGQDGCYRRDFTSLKSERRFHERERLLRDQISVVDVEPMAVMEYAHVCARRAGFTGRIADRDLAQSDNVPLTSVQ